MFKYLSLCLFHMLSLELFFFCLLCPVPMCLFLLCLILFCFILFILFYPLESCLFPNKKKVVLVERQGGKKLGGVEGKEAIIRIDYIGENLFSIKGKRPLLGCGWEPEENSRLHRVRLGSWKKKRR